MLRIATVNVNGVRASLNKSPNLGDWLRERECDIVAMQEVRAPDALVHELLADYGYHVAHNESVAKGRAGVALLSKAEPFDVRMGFPDGSFANTGRWLEADFALPRKKKLTVVSAYFPSGEVGTPRQDEKYLFYDEVSKHLPVLAANSEHVVVIGDYNVGHTELDIKNWKGNVKNAGFLPEERAYLNAFRDQHGWVDVHRLLAGEVEGPYTWWSARGQAFVNDTGWRIDYQWATPKLAAKAVSAIVDRAPSYEARWSDHAPLVVDYDI